MTKNEAMKLALVDDEGENQAVRMFLALYGSQAGITTKQMRQHLEMAGFDGAWPEWADKEMHLTKAGAQLWIRHLFALAEQPAQQEPVVCIIGTRGSAFDSPITKRAYTYKEQPGNAVASKLGRACNDAGKQRAGDNIDRGLGLLQELQNEGFGVFALGAEYTVTQQEPVAWTSDLLFDKDTEIIPASDKGKLGTGGLIIALYAKEKNT